MIDFFVPFEFTTLNQYIQIERSPKNGLGRAAQIKKTESGIVAQIAAVLPKVEDYPVRVHFVWHTRDLRTDIDNLAFCQKFILDGLVSAGVLVNDSRQYVTSVYHDAGEVDKRNPGVEVRISKA